MIIYNGKTKKWNNSLQPTYPNKSGKSSNDTPQVLDSASSKGEHGGTIKISNSQTEHQNSRLQSSGPPGGGGHHRRLNSHEERSNILKHQETYFNINGSIEEGEFDEENDRLVNDKVMTWLNGLDPDEARSFMRREITAAITTASN